MSRNRFILIWLCAAMVVVLVRGLAVCDLGYDLTVQLQAAEHLMAGNGISVYKLSGEEDLARSSTLVTLTHFPAAYSVLAAGLMWLGLGSAAVVKTAGAIATMLGWWGWALLAYAFFKEGLNRGLIWKCLALVLAVSSPLLLTPPWQGTDIFLWAAIPWTVHWIVEGATRSGRAWWFDCAAGAACGLAFLFRYAGAFLAVYAACLILFQTGFSWKLLFRRAAAFAAGSLPLVAIQVYINKVLATTPQSTVTLDVGHGLVPYLKAFIASFWMLPAANFSFAWWMPNRLVSRLAQPGATLLSETTPHSAWWMAIPLAAIVLLTPLIILWAGRWRNARDIRAAATGLFWMLPLFLWACTVVGVTSPLMGDYSFVADFRYYVPLIPLSVLVAYGLAASQPLSDTMGRRITRFASGAYTFAYAAMAGIGLLLVITPLPAGTSKRQKLLGTSGVFRWPGNGIVYDYSPTRQRAMALLQQNPEAVLITDQPQWFYAEPKVNRARIHRLGDLKSAYVNGPAEIFVVAWDAGGRDEDLYWRVVNGPPRRSDELSSLDNFHMLERFPAEQMKILETEVPPSKHVGLKAAGANGAVAAGPPN